MLLLPLAASSSTYLGGPFWPTRVIIWKYHCHNRDLGRPCKTRTAHKNAHEFITLSSYFFFVEVPPAALPDERGPGCCKYEELQEAGKGSQGAASCVVYCVGWLCDVAAARLLLLLAAPSTTSENEEKKIAFFSSHQWNLYASTTQIHIFIVWKPHIIN